MGEACRKWITVLAALLAGSTCAAAQSLQTRGAYCNDSYFGSDGGGLSGCMEFAARYGERVAGFGLYGVSPEQKHNQEDDPLEELARITAWYGESFERDGIDYFLAGRIGVQGGIADDLAISLKESLHDLFGFGSSGLESSHETIIVGGVAGTMRRDFALASAGTWETVLSPYAHAALGNDTLEAGGGLMLALQPAGNEGLALVLPKNGAYAPTFGGDGIGLFGAVRGIARESFYEDLGYPFLAEAGAMAQTTLWNFVVLGASASCTSIPYDGAVELDCKATLQMGGLF